MSKTYEHDITIYIETQVNHLDHNEKASFNLGPYYKTKTQKRGSGGIFVTSIGDIKFVYGNKEKQILIVDTCGIRLFIF